MSERPASRRMILVTGATSGIGRAVAEHLLGEGHAVLGVGRDHTKVDFGGRPFVPLTLDLGDLDTLPAGLEALVAAHPDVDAVVLCAGRGRFGHLEESSYAQIRALVDLNFTSQVYVARAFVPAMKRRGFGDVVLLGSEAAVAGRRQGTLYCASKFALRGFAQALREECAKSGVRVTLVNPGMVATPFFDRLGFAPGEAPENALEASEVAAVVGFVLAQRPGVVVDEIDLSPLKRVIVKRPPLA